MELVDVSALPPPWRLEEKWFDLLEVPTALRKHYSHLSEAELQMIEATRALALEYQGLAFLQENRSVVSIVRHVAHEIELLWLVGGKRRAVDFKRVLPALQRYADYRAWVSGLLEHQSINLDWPYWIDRVRTKSREREGRGPGLLGVCIYCSGHTVGQMGHAGWKTIEIRLFEQHLTERASWHDFAHTPFRFLHEHNLDVDCQECESEENKYGVVLSLGDAFRCEGSGWILQYSCAMEQRWKGVNVDATRLRDFLHRLTTCLEGITQHLLIASPQFRVDDEANIIPYSSRGG